MESPTVTKKGKFQNKNIKKSSKVIESDSDEDDFQDTFLKVGDVVTFKNGGSGIKGKQGFVVKYPSEKSNITTSSTTLITEKFIKQEVVKRKLGYGDIGYVVLLGDKCDRTKRNPGTIYGGFFSKKQFFCYPVTKQLKVG